MLRNYLKMALKVLARRKFFTFISLFGISITLLVLLVATAMLDQIFAPQKPETRSDRTLGIYQTTLRGENATYNGTSGYGMLDRILDGLPEEVPAVERISIFSGEPDTVISYVGGRKIESDLKRTDGAYWQILDHDFVEGGAFTAEDEASARHVAVINESTRDRFFGRVSAVGRTFEADGQRFRVGVVRDVPVLRLVSYAEVWVPLSTAKSKTFRKEYIGNFMAVILARSRSDFPTIKTAIDRRFRVAEKHIPDRKTFHSIDGGADTLFEAASRMLFGEGRERRPELLWALFIGFAVLFMLLPSVNLVNINLSRILDRASEIGVRKAFGASSRTLVTQFVVENVVLTLLGSAIGLVLAAAVLAGLNASGLIPYAELRLNLRVFFEGLALALFFGLFSGVYPAWRMSRLHPVQALRGRTL
jgi:putative ABC transport system permease protein